MGQAISDHFVEDCRTLSSNRMSAQELDALVMQNERFLFNTANYQLV